MNRITTEKSETEYELRIRAMGWALHGKRNIKDVAKIIRDAREIERYLRGEGGDVEIEIPSLTPC